MLQNATQMPYIEFITYLACQKGLPKQYYL